MERRYCYINYTIETIIMKKYATFRYLVNKIARHIDVDLGYNFVKLKYKIEVVMPFRNTQRDLHFYFIIFFVK